ncbi:uncharacterized protein EV154DRAFT_18979 [Mucor mucedo]|uniref:uncharacterized protein n=1 Tax=Mucor mucedo TaxID=29922 RepID=UPI00221FEF2B|nr:uncharacterized protein EV154DRAFT_18979 [Mucor mucedo]KAI7886218.1 hypothetical protein EV154DRAFT_18979 [Mucor mucedo]
MTWRQTEEYKKFWIDMKNKKTRLDVQEGCAQYVSNSAEDALGALTSTSRTEPSSSNSTFPSSLSLVNPVPSTNTDNRSIPLSPINSPVLAPWLFKGVDIALSFTKFKQAVSPWLWFR